MDKNEALKKFKHFAVENGFWRKFKENFEKEHENGNGLHLAETFIENYNKIMSYKEPIMLIRRLELFCAWSSTPEGSNYWEKMDAKWEKYCLENQIWFDYINALDYYNTFVNYL